jgi:hypothetical protein
MNLLPPAGPERRRALTRLAALAALLVAVWWYQSQPAAPPPPASNVPTGAPMSIATTTLPQAVRLADLDRAPAAVEVGRNPFDFGARPPAASSRVIVAPPVQLPPSPPAPEGPPPIALRLTGMMVSPGATRTMVTLRDQVTGALFHAFEGDVVDGRYRVVKVGRESVVVSYVDGSGSRTLGLGN